MGSGLPWERHSGAQGTGICLSGGGVRAAAFALGAVQQLQEDLGLLHGDQCADLLVGVSGGSYVAAASTIGARQQVTGTQVEPPPLAPTAPESDHISEHGRFLLSRMPFPQRLRRETGCALLGVGLRFIVNLIALPAVLAWIGVMLGLYAFLVERLTRNWAEWSDLTGRRGMELAGAALASLGVVCIGRGLYADSMSRRYRLRLGGLVLFLIGGPTLIAALERASALSEWDWWAGQPGVWAGVLVASVLVAWAAVPKLTFLSSYDSTQFRRLAVSGTAWLIRAAGLTLLCLSAVSGYRTIAAAWGSDAQAGDSTAGVAFFAVLTGTLILGWLSGRYPMHIWNRDRIATCFAIERSEQGVTLVGSNRLLSESAPVTVPNGARYPRLLISATANVRHVTPNGELRRFEPFVFSHDRCGIPGVPAASFTTGKLELGRASGRPLMTLMTAVACTGAAASPAMGHFGDKFPASRSIMMLLNARLGTWLPNPMSSSVRRYVEGRSGPWRLSTRFQGLGPGYDASIPELLALHREDAASLYISDGGHYDNLGLTTLLRARCKEVWCVDSEADNRGAAHQLRQVIELARDELHVTIDLDVDGFAATDGIMGTNVAVGTITYPIGPDDKVHPTGRLFVVKLGLTDASPYADLRGYRSNEDPLFPAHSTFRYLAFTPDRLDAYRKLGREAAKDAVAASGRAMTGDDE